MNNWVGCLNSFLVQLSLFFLSFCQISSVKNGENSNRKHRKRIKIKSILHGAVIDNVCEPLKKWNTSASVVTHNITQRLCSVTFPSLLDFTPGTQQPLLLLVKTIFVEGHSETRFLCVENTVLFVLLAINYESEFKVGTCLNLNNMKDFVVKTQWKAMKPKELCKNLPLVSKLAQQMEGFSIKVLDLFI